MPLGPKPGRLIFPSTDPNRTEPSIHILPGSTSVSFPSVKRVPRPRGHLPFPPPPPPRPPPPPPPPATPSLPPGVPSI